MWGAELQQERLQRRIVGTPRHPVNVRQGRGEMEGGAAVAFVQLVDEAGMSLMAAGEDDGLHARVEFDVTQQIELVGDVWQIAFDSPRHRTVA